VSTEIQQPADPEADEIASHAAQVAAPEVIAGSLGEYVRIWLSRVRAGESGALPVILGLGAIVAYFQIRTSLFLSAGNLVNLMSQAAWIVTLGMAEVFVLLLGEIDLSIGYSSAMGAVVTLWMVSPQDHFPWWIALLAGLAVPAAYSALQAVLITRLRAPSFVVTLGGLLLGEGLLLLLINSAAPNSGGIIRLPATNVLYYIENENVNPVADWIIMAAAVVASGAVFWVRDSRRRASNLAAPPASVTALKVAVMAVAGVVIVLIGNTNRGRFITAVRGLPWVVLIVTVLLIAWSVLLGRTRFGRYVYAIGGNAEAARRSGINLTRVRVLAFGLCGLTAGMMGIILASQQGGMSNNVNGGQNVLYAVAAAVIGGTSLFGGRGRMLGALLGGLIVAVIYNGLSLLGLGDAAQYMWTAAVLLAAITVDTLARRRRPDQ
jgi:D-xylose transport system permease protein